MNNTDFETVVVGRLAKIQLVMANKAVESSSDRDRLHDFKVAARISGSTPEKALWGMAMKHLVSVTDILDAVEGGRVPAPALVDEKLGDMINYLILLETLLVERQV